MPTRSIVWAGLLGVAVAALSGCPKTEPEEPVATADPEPDPPKKSAKKKPKCEDLAEKCVATPDTQARIANVDSVFIPPEGWMYAQQAEMTVAQPGEEPSATNHGAIAMTAFEGAGAEEAKARDAHYEKLVQGLEISVPEKFKKKYVPKWDKADDTRTTGTTEIKLWQAEQAKRAGKNGFLLVLLTTDPAGKKILGVAFAPEGDEKTVEAISKSLETIGPGSYQ